MNKFFTRNTPPGIDPWQEIGTFLLAQMLSLFFSFQFFGRYQSARAQLYHTVDGKRFLLEGAKIADFGEILGLSLYGFGLTAVAMLGFIVYHYAYYRQGSMSIYLMKRLPNPTERHRRAWTLPILAMAASMAVALAVLLIYFAIYLLATPKACLPDEIWRQLWRII